MINSFIYKIFAFLCWGLCALVGMIALRVGLELCKVLIIVLPDYNRLTAGQLGEFTGNGIAALVAFILIFFGAKFLFRKGKWLWNFSQLK